MHPIFLQIGSLVIHTYGILVALGFLAAIILASAKAREFHVDRDFVYDLSFWILLAALTGARTLEVLANFSYYRLEPIRILKIWEGGLSFFGGLIGGVLAGVAYVKYKKLSVWHVGDLIVPYLALGQAIGRIGCFFAGCCYGKVCTESWAVHFAHSQSLAPTGLPLHPTQIYESLADFLIFLILLNAGKRRAFSGQVFLLYFILYGAVRFIVEFYRGDNPAVWHTYTLYQIFSIVILAVAGTIYTIKWKKQKNK
ncbi:MAG: prolipoprotein diacylglyceryl transferase [bacterium]|nr:prolipoprotein diacylglyceryl transferase [bacterium]MDD5353988.1 prolipoprotein diacylglyceryl transferase [bacterium]MDD5757159.1 prolipoprotein diacylglyceryl transferase [bacterium]